MARDNNIPPRPRENAAPRKPAVKNQFHQAAGRSIPQQPGAGQKSFNDTLKDVLNQAQKQGQTVVSSAGEPRNSQPLTNERNTRPVKEQNKETRDKDKNVENNSKQPTKQSKKAPKASQDKDLDAVMETGEKTHEQEAEKKVVAKQDSSKNSGEGEDSKQESGQKSFAQQRNMTGQEALQQQPAEKKKPAAQQIALGSQNQPDQVKTQGIAASPLPQALSDEALQQIVQYIRIMTRSDGDKEMVMKLREEVFRGMNLRVAMVKGKVEATFETDSPDIRRLFESEKSNIIKALSEKSMAVGQINVILT